MNPNIENTELIDRYIKNELSKEELEQFNMKRKNDLEFDLEVRTHEILVEGIKYARKQELKNYLKEKGEVQYIGNMWGPRWVWASAAIFALFIGVYLVIEFYGKNNVVYQPVSETKEERKVEEDKKVTPDAEENQSDAPKKEIPIITETPEIAVIENFKPSATDKKLKEIDQQMDISEGAYPDNELMIKKDYKVFDSTYSIKDINWSDASVPQNNKVAVEEKITAKSAERKVDSQIVTPKQKSDTTQAPHQLEVEFWQSPINFKGYMFNGSKVLVYGIEKGKPLNWVQMGHELFLGFDSKWYMIESNDRFNNFKAIDDKKILKTLNN